MLISPLKQKAANFIAGNKYLSKISSLPKTHLLAAVVILLSIPLTVILSGQQQDLRKEIREKKQVIAATTQPNIVIVSIDDQNPFDGRQFKQEKTPAIYDTFVAKGIKFNNVFSQTSLCCPGRAGLLTGQHTHNHKVVELDGKKLDPTVTFATRLQGVGYYTIYAGKYLNEYTSFPVDTRIPPGWNKFDAIFESNGKYFDYDSISVGGAITHYGTAASAYSTDVYGNKALNNLKNAPTDKPVLIYFNPYASHLPETPAPRHKGDSRCASINPWKLPNYNEADVSDKPLYVRRKPLLSDTTGYNWTKICETLLSVEDAFKKIKTELQAQGRLNNTVFILTADNGDAKGEHRMPNKKTHPYSTRIPLYVSWINGRGTTPQTVGHYISNIDIAPTLCELAGCSMGPYPNGQTIPDGISFAPLLKNQTFTPTRDAMLESQPAYWSDVNEGDPDTMPLWYSVRTTPQSSLGLWRYTEYASGEKELYNHSGGLCYLWTPKKGGDPCELNNLLGPTSNPSNSVLELAAELKARLNQLKVEKGFNPPPTPTPSPTPTPTPTETTSPTPTSTASASPSP